jgi:hypothetical protein
MTTTASAIDIATFLSNGTFWYGSIAQAFS